MIELFACIIFINFLKLRNGFPSLYSIILLDEEIKFQSHSLIFFIMYLTLLFDFVGIRICVFILIYYLNPRMLLLE